MALILVIVCISDSSSHNHKGMFSHHTQVDWTRLQWNVLFLPLWQMWDNRCKFLFFFYFVSFLHRPQYCSGYDMSMLTILAVFCFCIIALKDKRMPLRSSCKSCGNSNLSGLCSTEKRSPNTQTGCNGMRKNTSKFIYSICDSTDR